MNSLVNILRRTEKYLGEKGVDSPRLDAELLLSHVLEMERLSLYLEYDRPLTEAELSALRPLVRRRGNREPLAWITERVSFYNVELSIQPGVLVPRPDTETLVDATIEMIDAHEDACFVADICCGSGAIGLAIATTREQIKVYCVDKSPIAIAVTRQNTRQLALTDRVAILQGDLLSPIPAERQIDIIASNPPYIRSKELKELGPEVSEHEPALALDGGDDGLDCYRKLVPLAAGRAKVGALFEVGHDQADAVAALLEASGFIDVRRHKDLAGIERVVSGCQPRT